MSISVNVAIHNDPSSTKTVSISTKNITKQTFTKIGTEDFNMKTVEAVYGKSGDEIKKYESIKEGDEIFLSSGAVLPSTHEVFHVCMLGAGAVGKSALTLQFIQGQFVPDYDPTIEDAYRKPTTIDGSPLLLDVLDTAGQEDFIALRASWMRNKDGFVLVFSIINKKSFEQIESFYEQICEVYEENPPPIILCGNKADLDNVEVLESNPKLYQREVSSKDAQKLAEKWSCCAYIETSAKTGTNVTELYSTLVRHIIAPKVKKTETNINPPWYTKCCLL